MSSNRLRSPVSSRRLIRRLFFSLLCNIMPFGNFVSLAVSVTSGSLNSYFGNT
jgi:hypothetical protein